MKQKRVLSWRSYILSTVSLSNAGAYVGMEISMQLPDTATAGMEITMQLPDTDTASMEIRMQLPNTISVGTEISM